MEKYKQLAIKEAEREYEQAHEEWQICQHEEEQDARAMQLDLLERHPRSFDVPKSIIPSMISKRVNNAGPDD